MILERLQDTIVAPATPAGHSALALVRISGPQTLRMCDQVFRGKRRLSELEGHRLVNGVIIHDEKIIDEAVAAVYRAPHSYTTEDLVEFSLHGNPLIVERVTDILVEMGARLARPGEFTERAFLYGRIDITQAEAVLAAVESRTWEGVAAAMAQLKGDLANQLTDITSRLRSLYSLIEAQLEFPEEDIPDHSLTGEIEELTSDFEELAQAFRRGRSQRTGLRVMIVGRANVGKSTLFNALLGKQRSIVTPVPGTTRDLVTGSLCFSRGRIRLFDGAGIGAAESLPDRIAARRARSAANRADFLVVILDAVTGFVPEDKGPLKLLETKPGVVVWNKIDLVTPVPVLPLPGFNPIPLSALKMTNLGSLVERLKAEVSREGETFFANRFQEERLKEIALRLHAARQADYLDMRAKELREALEALSGFERSALTNDVLDEIFSRFCVGK